MLSEKVSMGNCISKSNIENINILENLKIKSKNWKSHKFKKYFY